MQTCPFQARADLGRQRTFLTPSAPRTLHLVTKRPPSMILGVAGILVFFGGVILVILGATAGQVIPSMGSSLLFLGAAEFSLTRVAVAEKMQVGRPRFELGICSVSMSRHNR